MLFKEITISTSGSEYHLPTSTSHTTSSYTPNSGISVSSGGHTVSSADGHSSHSGGSSINSTVAGGGAGQPTAGVIPGVGQEGIFEKISSLT